MTLRLLPRPTAAEGESVHVIPVPVEMTVEEAWALIRRGVLLAHPLGEPSWAPILVDADGELVEVFRA